MQRVMDRGDNVAVFVEMARRQARKHQDDHRNSLQAQLDAWRQPAHIIIGHHGSDENRRWQEAFIHQRFVQAAGPVDQENADEKGEENSDAAQAGHRNFMHAALAGLIQPALPASEPPDEASKYIGQYQRQTKTGYQRYRWGERQQR